MAILLRIVDQTNAAIGQRREKTTIGVGIEHPAPIDRTNGPVRLRCLAHRAGKIAPIERLAIEEMYRKSARRGRPPFPLVRRLDPTPVEYLGWKDDHHRAQMYHRKPVVGLIHRTLEGRRLGMATPRGRPLLNRTTGGPFNSPRGGTRC